MGEDYVPYHGLHHSGGGGGGGGGGGEALPAMPRRSSFSELLMTQLPSETAAVDKGTGGCIDIDV